MYKKVRGKRILVTGGAGFIGANLCESFLENDNQVACLDNFLTGKRSNITTFLAHKNFELIEGDIRDPEVCMEAANGADLIFHQAALGSVPRSIKNPLQTNSVNITGFLNMLEAARQNEVERFIYAASSSTYGDSTELPKVEERIGKPLSPYAVTKYANELYAGVYSSLHDMEIIGLRYFNVFGKRQDPAGAYAAAIPKFIKALIEKRSPLIHGDGEQTRDFTYIANVIQANHLAGTTTNPRALGEVYNVACGSEIPVNKLVAMLREKLSQFDKKIADVQAEHGPYRVGDIRHSVASIDKAGKLLGYKPEYDMEKGLEEAISWYWEQFS
jgi:UDP-N-acetylglucosamine 4-epimerase